MMSEFWVVVRRAALIEAVARALNDDDPPAVEHLRRAAEIVDACVSPTSKRELESRKPERRISGLTPTLVDLVVNGRLYDVTERFTQEG